ncbi:hypothetical protein ACFOLF_22090 [Paenibacillus sepulcri]|uniref:hypothetical protein n=1 Tax=Paenibacillus sepulcri TaxID=359917 RepID=UPI0035EE59A2
MAISPELDGKGGVYCENCEIAMLADGKDAVNRAPSANLGVMPHAVDPDAAARLWSLSEQLVFGAKQA